MNREDCMHRCIELALLGMGHTAPNPMVGALLSYEGKIIGEGYHHAFGEAHAEKNAIEDAVAWGNSHLISQSDLFVSLEPCSHFGKTPPCTELIIKYKIPRVVIGCPDPNRDVAGKGIEKLREAGVEVKSGLLEKECRALNKRFFIYHEKKRPYIILKWAETADGFIAPLNPSSHSRLLITDEFADRVTHKWRSEEAALLIGTSTAALDDPRLTNRLWPGPSPIRLIIDMDLRLPKDLKVFDKSVPTIIFNLRKHSDEGDWTIYPKSTSSNYETLYWQVTNDFDLVHQLTSALYQLKIQSVIIEGGSKTLQSFIDDGDWDEARKITRQNLIIGKGLPSPLLPYCKKEAEQIVTDQLIEWFRPLDR